MNAIQYETHPAEVIEQVKDIAKNQEEAEKFLKKLPNFRESYQAWYSESLIVIKQLLPDRLGDFIKLYEKPKTRKEITYGNYVIEDYLQGMTVTKGHYKEKVVGPDAAIPQYKQQLQILKSVEKRFESTLFDIKQLVQADLFDSELESAKELAKNKFIRAAGAISGVVLEKHLSQVCKNHSISISKKNRL
jgi:hypothetical protein